MRSRRGSFGFPFVSEGFADDPVDDAGLGKEEARDRLPGDPFDSLCFGDELGERKTDVRRVRRTSGFSFTGFSG